eukprot:RCo043925
MDLRLPVEKKNSDERRLVEAVKKGDVKDGRKGMGVASLLERGVNVNCVDECGCTPLHYACSNGHIEAVQVLLQQAGIDTNAQDCYGRTALHWAAQCGHIEIVRLLMSTKGVRNGLKTNLGKTAGELARQYGQLDIVPLLSD